MGDRELEVGTMPGKSGIDAEVELAVSKVKWEQKVR
jgi:hypothetical protein